ncbi:NAD(P)/FAD-dependent oxidoreductase [Anaerotruncus massiliensis (ex Togo et al. 2019)]|uniref:NAD(P)/FAD-dependent oxidoreductase n=1 Tax=Anaerotruncus TaxID=244127 RepID=UPI000C78F874|nr:NAD(P)/FAD-dependent oxidoreductase [Anaerotruncus massiliensis (ex Togo et al. 2019)]
MSDLVVIGGGAAGLFAAGFAAKGGASVTVLERGARPARKLLITGKGRCNVTNNCSPEDFLRNVRTNPRFLYGAASAFSPADAMAFFESLGVPLKTERGGRVFPVSDRAADVADALVRFAKASGARLVTSARVTDILAEDGGVRGVRLEDGRELSADAVLVATGGCSYPATGSTGDGWRLAKALGHTVVPARASLVPVRAKEPWCAELMGLSLKNVTLTLRDARGKAVFSELGEMLFTHFGVSGPLVLSASSYLAGDPGGFRMEIDLKPGLDDRQLDARLLRDFSAAKNRDFANALDQLLPKKLIPVAVRLSGIPPDRKVNAVTREERRAFAALLKALPVTPAGLLPVEAGVVTAGGVAVREIDPRTMESKLVKGLYFAGEVIDVDALTGGYNLQIAWSTALLAAKGVNRNG